MYLLFLKMYYINTIQSVKNLNPQTKLHILLDKDISENMIYFLIVGRTSSNNTQGFLCICIIGSQDKGSFYGHVSRSIRTALYITEKKLIASSPKAGLKLRPQGDT